MVEENRQQREKKDWSRAESVLNSMKAPTAEPGHKAPASEGTLVTTDQSGIPQALVIPPPDPNASQGILAKWKASQMGRKQALDQLAEQYKGQLEFLKHKITEQVRVGKTQVSVAAEEYLKILDAKHLEVLAQLGMRNAATRWKAVTDLTDMAVAQVQEVENKNWPEQLITDTVAKIFALRERVAAEIMRELGIEHSKE
jgi:hypothetical protein